MGSALLFQADSLHVYAYNGDGNPEKDASNWTDITSNCAYSYDAGSRTVNMNLPDGKALKLVYRAEVNQVVGGKLDASNASNSSKNASNKNSSKNSYSNASDESNMSDTTDCHR